MALCQDKRGDEMKDIWTNINDNISIYLKKINEQHKISYVKLSSIQTALIGNNFALILSIDRFDVYVVIVILQKNLMTKIEKICY